MNSCSCPGWTGKRGGPAGPGSRHRGGSSPPGPPPVPDRWELDWEPTEAGEPSIDQVTAAIAADPVVSHYRPEIELATEGGAAVRWARAMRVPGAAVVLDTETTDLPGAVCELAVVDAATGATLIDTLVKPQTPITLGAHWVHGISDADLVDAPPWPQVLPGRWLPLDGGHRPRQDAQAALEMLRAMARHPGPRRPGAADQHGSQPGQGREDHEQQRRTSARG